MSSPNKTKPPDAQRSRSGSCCSVGRLPVLDLFDTIDIEQRLAHHAEHRCPALVVLDGDTEAIRTETDLARLSLKRNKRLKKLPRLRTQHLFKGVQAARAQMLRVDLERATVGEVDAGECPARGEPARVVHE